MCAVQRLAWVALLVGQDQEWREANEEPPTPSCTQEGLQGCLLARTSLLHMGPQPPERHLLNLSSSTPCQSQPAGHKLPQGRRKSWSGQRSKQVVLGGEKGRPQEK